MDHNYKWIALYSLLFLTHTGFGWTIGAKGRVMGPAIHATYFTTPNNAPVKVQAIAYLGFFSNNRCVYSATYNIGTTTLKTGDVVYVDGNLLQEVAGVTYNCIMINYTTHQQVMESFLLQSNGFSYFNSFPDSMKVNIS
jgi:hypothetical protein